MLKLLVRKLIQGVLLVLVTSAATFFLLAAAGGDAFSGLRDNPQVSQRTIDELRRVYGLDRPVGVRYLDWLGGAVRADLGESFYFKTPVAGMVATRLGDTAAVSFVALLFALAFSFILGFLHVRYRWRWLGRAIDLIVLLSASTPRIVLSLVGLAVAVALAITTTFWLAAFVLAAPLVAAFLAQFDESLRQVMKEDFIRTARAKGLSETTVILRHAIRGAVNPLLTLTGLSLGGLLGGSVIVETVLGRTGIGSLTVIAVRNRDIPLIMGIMLAVSIAVWAANALAEFLQMLNDKRLRSAETE